MNNGKTFQKISGINFCVTCKNFYISFCHCSQNSLNNEDEKLPSAPSPFAIYNYCNKLRKLEEDFHQVLEKKNEQTSKEIVPKEIDDFNSLSLSKYIYFCNHNKKCIKPTRSFYIYMMAIQLQNKDQNHQEPSNSQPSTEQSPESTPRTLISGKTSPSTSSLSSKKSTAGSVLSRISKTLKRKKKQTEKPNNNTLLGLKTSANSFSCSEGNQSETATLRSNPMPKLRSKSKIPVPKPRPQAQNSKEEIESFPSPKAAPKSRSFFHKLVAKPSKSEVDDIGQKLSSTRTNPFLSENQRKSHSCTKIQSQENSNHKFIQKECDMEECSFWTSSSYVFDQIRPDFLNLFQANSSLNEDLREVINLYQHLQESQSSLAHVISKYIQNHGFEKELLSVLTNHAKLHLEAERRAQNLTHELWLQQGEMMKAQEAALQENLSAVVKQNRQLQVEVENLVRKNEKLCVARAKQFPECMWQPSDSSNQLIENLSKNNDTLRYKISSITAQIQEQEKEFYILQRRNQLLEKRLRNSNSQLQNCKTMLQRVQTDNELEHAHLSHQLQASEMTIKETAEAGDVLLEDVDALKRQLKSMPCTLNWVKFKSRGSSLSDLIYMCRSCINELAKELMKSQTEVVLRDKDNDGLKEEIKRVENTLEVLRSEKEQLQDQLRLKDAQEIDVKEYMAKCNSLERELDEYKHNMKTVVGEFEKEKTTFITSVNNIDNLHKKVIEKEEELILTKEQMYEYKSENDALRMQIHGLKQVLTASGTGDVARELADTQEKMIFFQSQYYQLLSEKNYLVEQLQAANVERGALNQFQNNYYQFIQVQQQDLEMLNRDNLVLRQELEVERNQVSSLKMERAKLKEEKNIMKQIYHQLKTEISRAQKLQGEVAGMNIEANRLAIIAEYNRQLGEKLQCEVSDRDEKISELQSSVEKLNSAQIESNKDKVALCVELTEVCTRNHQLNTSLAAEHQKITHLNESKRMIETSASTQLRAVEEMQKAERAALRELLKDFKSVVTQRDNLVASQNEYLQQISDLRTNALIQARSLEEANSKCKQALGSTESLKSSLKESEKELDKVRGAITEKQNISMRLEEELKQLETKNEVLEQSKTYLQNTLQKMHNDLNDSRKSEMEAKQALKKEVKKNEVLQFTLDQTKATLVQASRENQQMVQEVANFSEVYEKLLSDYKANMTSSAVTQQGLIKEVEEAKMLAEKSDKEIERLQKVVAEKDLGFLELQECSKSLAEEMQQMETSLGDIDVQSKLLSESNSALVQLQEALTSLQAQHDDCSETISMLSDENHKLKNELQVHLQGMEAHYAYYRSYIEEIIKEHNDQRKEMTSDLHDLSIKLQEMKEDCEKEKEAHDKLMKTHKDFAAKLLKAVRMLIAEKLNRQNVEANITKISDQTAQLASEKEAAEKTVSLMLNELEEMRSRVGDLVADKKSLQEVLSDLQELYRRSQLKCHESEQQLQNVRKKIKAPSTRSSKIITLKDTKTRLQSTEERTKRLKNDLEKSHKTIMELKSAISDLQQQLTVTEFQKCEVALRLHEIEAKLKTEQTVNTELVEVNQQMVTEIIRMKREEMEHISPPQVQKYEHILNQIDSEYKNYESLKKEIEKETNKLIAARVAMQENLAKESVFKVLIKIFNSVFEIFYLYGEDLLIQELESFHKLSNCKFYVVEVYISKVFQQKIVSQNWLLNICIKNSKMCVSKNVAVKKGQINNRILVVVPFDTSVETSTVNTTLFLYFDTFCSSLRISTLTIDISYHFALYEKPSVSPLIKLAQNYNPNLDLNLLKIPSLEYNLKCKCSTKHFFESVVQNCYHRLKPQIFSAFTEETTSVISVHFSISNEHDTVIKLDKTENVLSISCNIHDLYRIKKYFIEEIRCQKVCIEKAWLLALMNTKQYLRGELSQPNVNLGNLKIIYEELRKLMFNLVV